MDTAMLLVRLTIGTLFIGHGAQHALGWFGGYGASGTGAWLESFGFRHGRRLAIALGASEIAVGILFGAGFLVPLAAAGIVGIALAAAMTDHAGKGPWVWKNGYEYVLVLGVVAAAVVFAGPGTASLDHLLGLTMSGTGWGIGAALTGLGSGFTVLSRRKPVTSAPTATTAAPTVG